MSDWNNMISILKSLGVRITNDRRKEFSKEWKNCKRTLRGQELINCAVTRITGTPYPKPKIVVVPRKRIPEAIEIKVSDLKNLERISGDYYVVVHFKKGLTDALESAKREFAELEDPEKKAPRVGQVEVMLDLRQDSGIPGETTVIGSNKGQVTIETPQWETHIVVPKSNLEYIQYLNREISKEDLTEYMKVVKLTDNQDPIYGQIKRESNLNKIIDGIGSEAFNLWMRNPDNSVLLYKLGSIMNLEEMLAQKFLDAPVGHCVFSEGICRALRSEADRYQMSDNRQTRKKANKLLEVAKELEVLGNEKFSEGINKDDLYDVCKQYNITVSMEFPLHGKYYKLNDMPRPLIKVTLKNLRRNHMDLYYEENKDPLFVDDNTFEVLIDEYKKKGALLVKTYYNSKHEPDIYSFVYLNIHVVRDSFKDMYSKDGTYSKFMEELRMYSVCGTAPYYPFIRAACHVAGHTGLPNIMSNWDEYSLDLASGSINKRDIKKEFKEDLFYQDHIKCYTQFNKSKYFNKEKGFPGKPQYYKYDPEEEIYLNELGWWEIITEDSLPHQKDLNGVWTTPHLRFFRDHGIKFTVIFGCWSKMYAPLKEFPEEMKKKSSCIPHYSIIVGRWMQNMGNKKSKWLDSTGFLDKELFGEDVIRESDFKMSKLFEATTKKEKWNNYANLASYILAYAHTQIWERIIEVNKTSEVIAIKGDSIITIGRVPDVPNWHPCKPVEYEKLEKTIIWSPSFLSNQRTYEKPKPTKTHNLTNYSNPEPVTVFNGGGGYGKTEYCIDVLGWLQPTYVTLTKALVKDKKEEFDDCAQTSHSLWKDQINEHSHFIVLDEITLIPEKLFKEIMEEQKKIGYRLIIAGDRAQLPGYGLQETMKKRWEYLGEFQQVEFLTNYRAKDQQLKDLCRDLRDLVLSGLSEDVKIDEMFDLIHNNCREGSDSDNTIRVRFRKPKESEKNTYSVDSLQGKTISKHGTIHINKHTPRRSQLPELLYTAVSRFTRMSHISVVDKTAASEYYLRIAIEEEQKRQIEEEEKARKKSIK